MQLLEGEIAIGTHAGVVEGDVVTHTADVDAMLASPTLTAIAAVVVVGGMHSAFHDGSAIGLAVVDIDRRHLANCAALQSDRLAHRHLLARRQGGIGIHGVFAGQQVFKTIHAIGAGLNIVAEIGLIAIHDEDIGLGSRHGIGSQGVVVVGMMHQLHKALHRARAALARAFVARWQKEHHRNQGK